MKRRLAIASILLVIATLGLKVSGLIRDIILAKYFGDSAEAAAYLIAFIVPNMFILLFTTGMKNAFVPSYIQSLERGQGHYHFSQVIRGTAIIGLFVSIGGLLLTPMYLPIIFPDFTEATLAISRTTSFIFFIAIFFVSLNAVYEAYLDAENKFSLSVISQIIVIGSTIVSALLFAKTIGVYSFAYGYLVGTILSLFVKKLVFIPKGTHKIFGKMDVKEYKNFFLIFIPVAITVMVGQVNLFIDNIFAGNLSTKAVTYINYAKNITHFPQAILGVTIGTIIFPILSKAVAQKKDKEFRNAIERGLVLSLSIVLPAIVGMMWLMPEIIKVAFERGKFTASATESTVLVAYLYAGSVLFFSLINVINKGFYSRNKGNLILRISLFSILLNILLNFIFISWLDSYLGIPLASSVMAFVFFTLNIIVFQRIEVRFNWKTLSFETSKVVLSVIGMIFVLMIIKPYFSQWHVILYLLITAVLGSITYGALLVLFKGQAVGLLFSKFRRKG
ncbi:murein biosynthesis protein MurJ [Lottiidibacillus patelloidae]|uniref:Murein biosynthesis protein MurJ n=1 Tax=Lottiidibacillus patelloidae TaxID=2670334 RepID=A0A263BSV7_9BACI|nr:lipid II flippase MurJ [Lottiidibacillus patelloidae]OZM56648.1 murein biosynthesis protein MurJ [Lottiidibacillus patelloidae]